MSLEFLQTTSASVKTLAILYGIVLVSHALWVDYFRGQLENPPNADAEANVDTEADPRAGRMLAVKSASLIVFIALVLIYFSNESARQEAPGFSLAALVISLIIQGQVSFGLEKKIRGSEASHRENLRITLRSALWSLASLGTYMVCIFSFCGLAILLSTSAGFSRELTLVAVLVANVVGTLSGLGLTFALAPFFMRRTFPTGANGDQALNERITGIFEMAKLPVPDVRIIELERFRDANAMIAGFARGRGVFKPCLFLTRSLMNQFSGAELDAIIRHETSHLALSHLRKRFSFSLKVLLGTGLSCTIVFAVAYLAFPPALRAVVGLMIALIAFLYPFIALRDQVKEQEFEADRHAVLELGADPDAFIRALRRLDAINCLPSERSSSLTTHPVTENRIQAIRDAVAFNTELTKAAETEFDRAA